MIYIYEIKSRVTGAVLFSAEAMSIKECVELAIKSGANLDGANLNGANYGDGVTLEHKPLQILGTKYFILIMDTHIKIGCKLYSHKEWSTFSDAFISRMGYGALEWWNEWKDFILSMSLGHQQRIAKIK